MSPSLPTPSSGANPGTHLRYRWRGYTVRWLLFGLVVSVFQPVEDGLHTLWAQKLNQALAGLLFGASCAAIFTPMENLLNTPRIKWKSWLLVIGTWLVVKMAFVSMIAFAGG